MKINQHRDLAPSGHLRYERGLILFEETSYSGKRLDEYIGHFAALTISGSKCKHGYVVSLDGQALRLSVSDPEILGENDPFSIADFAELMFVFGVSGEQVVVDIDLSALLLEGIGNRLLP